MIEKKTSQPANQGFLLIEIMVAISIILVFMTIVINDRDNFTRAVSLNNIAHEVALTVRQAQSYGISSQGSDIGDDLYDFAYGVHFNVASSSGSFSLYRYSTDQDGSNPEQGELINEYQLPSRMEFTETCTFDDDLASGVCDEDGSSIILFRRPNPDASFFDAAGSSVDANNAVIVLEDDNGGERMIIINTTGYIYVE